MENNFKKKKSRIEVELDSFTDDNSKRNYNKTEYN